MKKYTKADVSEQELEDLVRRNTAFIEEGLVYVDHQRLQGCTLVYKLTMDIRDILNYST